MPRPKLAPCNPAVLTPPPPAAFTLTPRTSPGTSPGAASAAAAAAAVANQRADTQGSLCTPDCESLNLPRDIILIKMVPREPEEGEDLNGVACDMETVTKTKNAHAKGHIILLQVRVCGGGACVRLA